MKTIRIIVLSALVSSCANNGISFSAEWQDPKHPEFKASITTEK